MPIHNSPDVHLLVLLLVILYAQFLQFQIFLGTVESQLRPHEISRLLLSLVVLQI